jgi:hypothetical protein
MKKNYFVSYVLFWMSILALGFSLHAQVVEKRPETPLKGSWYKESPAFMQFSTRGINPFISACINQVSADSIRATLRSLQNMGTRYLLADNRKDVANWLVQKFKSFGYSDTEVKIDSFFLYVNYGGVEDSTYQYDVVCTLRGSSAPNENYVIGGHYDSFCFEYSLHTAPGIDDNGTAVAATIEIARIMKMMNYQPEATIKFALFAAEELGLFGSNYLAEKARMDGEDIRYMLNMDMIANNPDSLKEIKIYRYLYAERAGDLAADCFQRYTNLNVFVPQANIPSGTDSYSYWAYGFPATSLEEIAFSPNWHKLSDTVGNCNLEYCAENTKGALATLLEQQFSPFPQNLSASSTKDAISLYWKPTENSRILGYNIYRSENISEGFLKINSSGLINDSTYSDSDPIPGKNYYYFIRGVNDSIQESFPSNIVWGSRFSFTDSLLVVACLSGNGTTPDSIRNYYQSVLDTLPYRWFDQNQLNSLDLGTLSHYQNVLWLLNSSNFEPLTDTVSNNIYSFFQNGGNMLFSGFTPSRYLDQNTIYPVKNPEYSPLRFFFKIDSVDRKVPCLMYRANPEKTGYDSLHIDPAKSNYTSYSGEILNIEVFAPTEESEVIYSLDSHYSITSPLGSMKGRPVGIEYKGIDYTTILLSFPLYYLDTSEARNFLKYVMKEKFSHPTAIDDNKFPGNEEMLQNYPNPFNERTTISFVLKEATNVNLTVYNMRGSVVAQPLDKKLECGNYSINFSSSQLPAGIYQMVMRTSDQVGVRKIVVVR